MSSIREIALAKAIGGSGGGGVTVEPITITENGTATAPSGKAYSPVNVNVPNSYAAGDEGKVVSDGALVSQTSTTKNANGTYDTTLNNEVVVNVPNSYSAGDEGKVVSNGALVAQTAHATVTENGTIDTTLNNSVVVDVSGGGGGGPVEWTVSAAEDTEYVRGVAISTNSLSAFAFTATAEVTNA